MDAPAPRLWMDASLLAEIRAAASAAYPEECCGLLIGRDDPAGWSLTRWLPAANVHPLPRRNFELDPAAHIALLRQLRGAGPDGGERLLGHVHSHPDAIAAPSAQDRALAHDPDMLWVIIAVDFGHPGPATAWKPLPAPKGSRAFQPIPLVIGKENADYEKSP